MKNISKTLIKTLTNAPLRKMADIWASQGKNLRGKCISQIEKIEAAPHTYQFEDLEIFGRLLACWEIVEGKEKNKTIPELLTRLEKAKKINQG